ncbi:DUF3302 domain-containing protein [Calycomorphotria hydatis]|uniref:Inner membrane protein YiaW n=1 Tax=Calycomorphotria hydatis TaxID=2528027 RepID=A0A517TDR0_9PLAN|nr:DUF3302 domain-containing protein [Calycomorphotria hydatis]QDT66502.1 Inner membrane protein YiaW [Calycomorphotria hydatis]
MLDYFALFILLTLGASVVGIVLLLAIMPGRIARQRNHPQADAIAVCGYWGVLTLGILLPVAYVWAYTHIGEPAETEGTDP